jgi:hypothetical protein
VTFRCGSLVKEVSAWQTQGAPRKGGVFFA